MPTELLPESLTYLIGPNGSGKTAVLQALCRLFAFEPQLRRIQRSDFHIPFDENESSEERRLWIEADFEFPELAIEDDNSTVPPHFGHMRLDRADGIPRVRFRLTAHLGPDSEIEESLTYVLDANPDGSPATTAIVPRLERNCIRVHYLPARRDPADHISHGTSALLGRLLRATNWDTERSSVKDLADQISASLASNPSITALGTSLKGAWSSLHKGAFVANPQVTFLGSEIESLMRHISISFSPGHDGNLVDFSRLSDGQKSMLYLSLVLSSQAIGRAVLSGDNKSFDVSKLRPPVFTLVAVEEPENSLSPHFLGRIVSALNLLSSKGDAQALLATHAPSMLRRVAPEKIRYLRLSEERTTRITRIRMPNQAHEAHKFVREAIQAFPEVYFARLVVLGEGDSEEIVLPRLFQARQISADEAAVVIAPLGGRHVNHFWKLLSDLEIPYLTLLDLDVARNQGGWGRIKYVNDQLGKHRPEAKLPADFGIPEWNSTNDPVREYDNYLDELEERGIYFSYPLDLDFAMLLAYPDAYGVVEKAPSKSVINAVLGESHHDADQYGEDEKALFNSYHRHFKLGSKPAAHFAGLSTLNDEDLVAQMPDSIDRLVDAIAAKLETLPE